MKNDVRRLSILSTDEIDELFGLPHFSDDDRRLYFDYKCSISIPQLQILRLHRTIPHR